jgi:hypothetical protein
MDHLPLVDRDIENGRLLVDRLAATGVKIVGAFWFYFTDREQWRLVIVTPDAESGVRPLYVKAHDAEVNLDTTLVQFAPPSSREFKALGRYIDDGGQNDLHLRMNMLDGVYVDEALIYRLAA